MQLYIIRHADPDYSIDDLTDIGHQEAAALGKRMASIGLDKLYASSLGRAQTTASYIAKETGIAVDTQAWNSRSWIGRELSFRMRSMALFGITLVNIFLSYQAGNGNGGMRRIFG